MDLFNNKSGYRPSRGLIEWWLLLPQNSSSYHKGKIPTVFGDPKNVVIHFILVMLLIISELVLIFQLENNGVDYKVLLILSIIDFVIAILPVIIIKFVLKWYPTEVKARIFIAKANIDYNMDPANQHQLKKELKGWQGRKTILDLLNIISIAIILIFSGWKFSSFYQVLGSDIFTEPIGRFVMGIILLSILVHILSTKIVFVSLWFFPKFKREWKEFDENKSFSTTSSEINKYKQIEFSSIFKPAVSLNQRVAQEAMASETAFNQIISMMTYDGVNRFYRVDKFTKGSPIHIIYTGILTDSEIQALCNGQDKEAQQAFIATCKDIQLSQI